MGAEKAKHLVTLALTLKISRDFNKLSYLAGSAYTMNAQVCGGGHMIDAYTQLKGVFVNILSSHIYPLHLVYMCAPVQACTCTTHAQGWTCMHNCTHMLFYSSVLFFLFSYLSLLLLYLFLSLSHSFSRNILFPYVFLPPSPETIILLTGNLRIFPLINAEIGTWPKHGQTLLSRDTTLLQLGHLMEWPKGALHELLLLKFSAIALILYLSPGY